MMNFNPEITLGTVINLVVILLTVGGTWASLKTRLGTMEKDILRFEKAIEDMMKAHQEMHDSQLKMDMRLQFLESRHKELHNECLVTKP